MTLVLGSEITFIRSSCANNASRAAKGERAAGHIAVGDGAGANHGPGAHLYAVVNHCAHPYRSAFFDHRLPPGRRCRRKAGKIPESCVMVEGRACIKDGKRSRGSSDTDD